MRRIISDTSTTPRCVPQMEADIKLCEELLAMDSFSVKGARRPRLHLPSAAYHKLSHKWNSGMQRRIPTIATPR